MNAFKDSAGHEWQVTITVATVKRVRDLVGVDLLEAAGGELLRTLALDPVVLVDVLYAVCKPQADAACIEPEAFGSGMAGDVIDDATVAFLAELVDFFPKSRRQMLRAVIAKFDEAMEAAYAAAQERIDSPEMKALIDAETKKIGEVPGNSSTNSPESSE